MVFHEIVPWKKGNRNLSIRPAEDEYPLGALQRRMNRMFDDFFGDFGSLSLSPFHGTDGGEGFFPRMDVAETDKEITINAELAGIDEKDVDITLLDNVLTVRGEKNIHRDEKKECSHLIERSYGTFSRSIVLPVEVQEDKIEASFKNGVLTVRLPKVPVAQAKATKIEIKNQ